MDAGETSHAPRLPGYEILRRIDRGDGAVSYLAVDAHGRRVECLVGPSHSRPPDEIPGPAVPRADTRPDAGNPHLVAVIDVFDDVDLPGTGERADVVLIEYLQGGTVAALVNNFGALSFGQTVTVMEPIASAVAHVHGGGGFVGGIGTRTVFLAASGMPKLLPQPATRIRGAAQPVTPDDAVSTRAGQLADVRDLSTMAWTLLTGQSPPADQMRPPIRVYHPDLPECLAEAIEALDSMTADDFARAVRRAGSDSPDAAPAPIRLVRTDTCEPTADALTAQLRLSALTAHGDAPDRSAEDKPALQQTRSSRRTARARHRQRRPAGRLLWLAGGAVAVAAGIGAVAAVSAGSGSPDSRTHTAATAGTPAKSGTPATSALHPLPPAIKKAAASPDPVRAVTGLVWVRADMFRAGQRRRLRLLDVPGSSAWTHDASKLDALGSSGARLAGLEMTVVSAGQLSRHAGTAVVAVTVDTSDYRQVDSSGTTSARRHGDRQTHRLRLKRTDGRWLIASVG